MGIAALPGVNRSTRSITTAWQRMTVAINSIITPRLASSSCGGCRSLRRHRYSFCLRPEWEAICCKALAQGNREVAMATTFSATQEGDVISDHRLIAQVLREAFPYIDFLKGKTLVIKLGGRTLEHQRFVLEDITWLRALGASPVLVHGGGPYINAWLEKLQVPAHFENGLRVTDAQTLDIVRMVLRGQVNQDLVLMVSQMGGKAIGLCGTDGNLVHARIADERLGFVGEIESVDPTLVQTLIDQEYIPVIAPLGQGPGGACLDALVTVPRVHIVDGREPHVLLRELFTDRGAGTMIVRNDAP